MRRRALLASAVGLLAGAAPAYAFEHPSFIVDRYYPERDSAADLLLAIDRATAEHRRILLIVGGEWCPPCHVLDRFLRRNADVMDEFAASFVILKINYSLPYPNREFLGRYPLAPGFPHFFILSQGGAFEAEQRSDDFGGRNYDRESLIAFAQRWRL